MERENFITVEAEGSPYEIGFAHGSKGKEKVLNSLNWYRNRLTTSAGTDWEGIKNFSAKYISIINDYDPDILEEMRGVADGSALELEDIVALNARTEILRKGKNLEGCTSFSVMPELTSTGDTLLGQNWDWTMAQKEAVLVLKIKQNGKPTICMVTEGGLIGKIGFNSCGIGVCFNALKSANESGIGIPAHVILRGILNSENLGDAIRAVSRGGIACSANYLIACSEGEAADVEADTLDYDVVFPVEGIIAHANHYSSPRLAMMKDYIKYRTPNSLLRERRLNQLLKKNSSKISINDLQAMLSDHFLSPDSICRHEGPKVKRGTSVGTVFSVVMNLNKREMIAAKGNPCCNEFFTFSID
jgi:isopenicillin-N N-acyltransferase like protein